MSSSIGAFLCPPEYAGPRGMRALARESSVALEAVRGDRRRRADLRARRDEPFARLGRLPVTEPVLLVPGFMAGDWSLNRMAAFLRAQGLRTYRVQISLNSGCTMRAAERVERRLESIAIRRDSLVTIVGHSLGGMLARGLAARRPDLVAGIVTMGSPVLAPGAVHDLLGWNARMLTHLSRAGFSGVMSEDCVAGQCARESWEETQSPLDPSVRYTAIYSRRDGIVDWRSCLDPFAEHVGVRTSHVGMALDPDVFDKVVLALQGQRLSRAGQPVQSGHEPDGKPEITRVAGQ
ncbi:MAG: esterase/lipase family protein [Marmoricola sp.]